MQPIGTPFTPVQPTLTDQETAGSSGAVSLSWPAVDANGPLPVRYTVFRDGVALPACTNILKRGCDNAGLTYDGHVYLYSVQATNSDGKGNTSATGPPTQWRATGKPASWGGWSLLPTGNNNQAKATFTVPASRGSDSQVRVYADGVKVQQLAGTGDLEAVFEVANNLGPHSVMLEVCNEGGACTQSSVQNVQTYGPITQSNIHAITPTINVTPISWTIEVDSNGDPATVTVTSDHGRNEQFNVPVGVSTVTTQPMDFGYQTTETVTVTLSDASPGRGSVTGTNSATTEPPPPPTRRRSPRAPPATTTRRPASSRATSGTRRDPTAPTPRARSSHIDLEQLATDGPGRVFCSVNGGHDLPEPFRPQRETRTRPTTSASPEHDCHGVLLRRSSSRGRLAPLHLVNHAPRRGDHVTISQQQAAWFKQTFDQLTDNMEQAVLGKRQVVRLALTCLLSEGHILLEDYPGTGKTMLARALANTVQGSHARIQFTPDLLPSDVTGVTIYDQHKGSFEFHQGPIFHTIVLADEINRASPKTQSALLEVMEENRVTVDGVAHAVGRPFLVIATQNPIEQAGTYRLPEAQLDRFLMKTAVGYPDRAATVELLVNAKVRDRAALVAPVITAAAIGADERAGRRRVRRPGRARLRRRAGRGVAPPAARPAGALGPRLPGAGPGRQDLGRRRRPRPRAARRRQGAGRAGAVPPAAARRRGPVQRRHHRERDRPPPRQRRPAHRPRGLRST